MLHFFKMPCREKANMSVALVPECMLTRLQLIEVADHRHWTCKLKVSVSLAGPFEVVGTGRVYVDQSRAGHDAADAVSVIAPFNRRQKFAEIIFKDDIENCSVEVHAPELYEMRNDSVLGVLVVGITCVARTAGDDAHEALVKLRLDVSDFKVSGVAFGAYQIREPAEAVARRVA